jgi:hypothetical protein
MNQPKSKGSSQWDSGGSTKFSFGSSVVGSSTGEIEGLASWLLPPTVDDGLEYFLDNRVAVFSCMSMTSDVATSRPPLIAPSKEETMAPFHFFDYFMASTAVSQARQ